MQSTDSNPELSVFLRAITGVETLVLIGASFGLFFLPSLTLQVWPWVLAPFNARFLGALYFAAMLPVGIMFLTGRWSPSRPVLRGIFVFTTIVLIVSVFYLSQFDLSYYPVWVWFAIYIVLPLNAAYHLWRYRDMPTEHLAPTPAPFRLIALVLGVMTLIYGIGLIVLPATFSGLFPWGLDAYHSQLYSAIFVTSSVMLFSVANVATPAEFMTVGATSAAFGFFTLLGLFIVDAAVNKIDYAALNTLAWLAFFVIYLIAGAAMILAGARGVPRHAGN